MKYMCDMQCVYAVCYDMCNMCDTCNRESWIALGPAMQALAFDFYDAEANMKPSEVQLHCRTHLTKQKRNMSRSVGSNLMQARK